MIKLENIEFLSDADVVVVDVEVVDDVVVEELEGIVEELIVVVVVVEFE